MAVQVVRIRIADAAVDARNGVHAAAFRPQNGWGLALLAEMQQSARRPGAAIAISRQALERTPLTVRAVRTLAAAQGSAGQVSASERAWQVASAMGWRDRQTQFWALLRAMGNGEVDVFVMRADALMRTNDDDPQIHSVLRQALSEPAIRTAFVGRLAINPEWRMRLFSSPAPIAGRELSGTVETLHALAGSANPPSRDELRGSILGLAHAGRIADAVTLDRKFVRRRPDSGSLLDDGGFDRAGTDYRKNVTPFDWVIERGAALDQSGGRKSLLVIKDQRRRPRVERWVMLAPGRYRLTYSVQGPPDAGVSLGVLAQCIGSDATLGSSARRPLAGEGRERRGFAFAVPAACPLVRLIITGLPGEPTEGLFDDFALTAAG